MSHTHHEALPGYDARQILHDGCPECERRGANVEMALSYMDETRFAEAWNRARQFHTGVKLNVSAAEAPLLRTLRAVQVHLDFATGHALSLG